MTNLTDEQQLVADHNGGHAIVSASPGSGKTTTLVEFVKNQLDDGLTQGTLLVLMFNNSTSEDFKLKLKKSGVNIDDKRPFVYTYHAMARKLCLFFQNKGYMEKHVLETQEWKLKAAARDALIANYGQAQFNQRKTELIDNFLSFNDYQKSGFLSPKETFDLMGFKSDDLKLLDAFEDFETKRKDSRVLYFSDWLTKVVEVLQTNSEALAKSTNLKDRIIIDEFQDSNPVQYELVKILAGDRAKLMVVGDVDQSIYEWRGADPQIMLHQVGKDYPGSSLYTMTKTFRYGPDLATITKRLIENNKDRFDQFCEPFNKDHEMDISIAGLQTLHEPEFIVNQIKDQLSSGRKHKDIAVLCRTYGSVGGVEMELLTQGIPAIIPKSSSILVSREMNVMLSIVKIASNFEGNDKKTGWRNSILRHPEEFQTLMEHCKMNYLGAGLRAKFIKAFLEENPEFLSPDEYVRSRHFVDHPLSSELIRAGKGKFNLLKDASLDMTLALEYATRPNKLDVQIERVFRGMDIQKHLESKSMTATDVDTSKRRVEAITKYIKHHDLDIYGFMTGIDELKVQQENVKSVEDAILLSSIHKAKGLEWPVVIMPSMEHGLFPFMPGGADISRDKMESERRLAYVGATRAQEELLITCPEDRYFDRYMSSGGRGNFQSNSGVSIFLWEMASNCGDVKLKYIPSGEAMEKPKKSWSDYSSPAL